jgi:hypothetical protein
MGDHLAAWAGGVSSAVSSVANAERSVVFFMGISEILIQPILMTNVPGGQPLVPCSGKTCVVGVHLMQND